MEPCSQEHATDPYPEPSRFIRTEQAMGVVSHPYNYTACNTSAEWLSLFSLSFKILITCAQAFHTVAPSCYAPSALTWKL
jgi:hypothetical protein